MKLILSCTVAFLFGGGEFWLWVFFVGVFFGFTCCWFFIYFLFFLRNLIVQYPRSLDFIRNAVAQEAIVETTSNTFVCIHTAAILKKPCRQDSQLSNNMLKRLCDLFIRHIYNSRVKGIQSFFTGTHTLKMIKITSDSEP